jgi:TolB-like protein/DNA-binding winged helix-turn-helix (wHTH) protein
MSLASKDLYRFDEFELDPSRWALERNGAAVTVSPKAFEVLTYLVNNPGRVVTKEELLKAVWPDAYVEESNLSQHISWLRKAFGDRSNYIVTVPGRGYQFTASVQVQAHSDSLAKRRDSDTHGQMVKESGPGAIQDSSTAASNSDPVGSSVQPDALGSSLNWALDSKARGRRVRYLAALLTLLVAVTGYFSYRKFGKTLFRPAVSIAILPFANLTGDPTKEYLSDGITEEMINDLARSEAGRLRVIARTSSMSYKASAKPVRQVAQELGVQYVLEGSVQSEGNRLHVTAQLIRGDDQSYFWADTFDGDADQILEFENRLTDSIARSLSLTLLAGTTPEHTPASHAAHDAYLQGLSYLAQRSKSGLENALLSFGRAVAEDPHYARAYAELAVTYNLTGQFGWMSPEQAHSQAKAAALQAIASDENLAEAHAALGFTTWFYEWNSSAAEKELRRAIELEPTNVDAHHWYALLLMTSGRAADAESQMRAALALDPKALILRTNLGWLFYTDRQYSRAIEEMQAVVKDNPDFLTAHYKLWWAYSMTGDSPHAWSELKAVADSIFSSDKQREIVAVYEKEGYAAALKTIAVSTDGYLSNSVDDARCMAFAGDKSAALALLARALEKREGWMIVVESDPAFDGLRSEPEYSRLMQQVHTISESSR